MSDKTREQVRKDFESQILKSIKYANLERDALSDYISPFTLASWQSWQAAHEMYAPKCDAVEVAARTGFRAGWCYAGNNGIEMAETFAADYAHYRYRSRMNEQQ